MIAIALMDNNLFEKGIKGLDKILIIQTIA